MEIHINKWNMTNEARLFDGEKYCILGWLGRYIGVPDHILYNKSYLTDCAETLPEDMMWLVKSCNWDRNVFSSVENMLVWLNDKKEPMTAKKKNMDKFFSRLDVKINWS